MSNRSIVQELIVRAILVSIFSSLIYLPVAFGKDFGTQSTTFSIKEEGFLSQIQRRLASIDIAAHQKKMRDAVTKTVEEPKAVANITKASKTTTHYFDPSYILDHDVVLPSGKLLYAAGTPVNPLDHLSWTGKMIFIDARDQSQITWLKEHRVNPKINDTDTGNQDDDKIILVGGKPLQLAKDINYQVYFDQFGELSNRFSIVHVPAIVEQDAKQLKITQIHIGD